MSKDAHEATYQDWRRMHGRAGRVVPPTCAAWLAASVAEWMSRPMSADELARDRRDAHRRER